MLTRERIKEAFDSVGLGVFPELSKEEYEAFKNTYDRDGNTIFHKGAMRYPPCLPEGFKDFHIRKDPRNGTGETVAHSAAKLRNLPEDFNDWLMRDNGERTVAHVFAEANVLPANFPHWGEVDRFDKTVAFVAAKNGTLPRDYANWGILGSNIGEGSSVAMTAFSNGGFFKGREREAFDLKTINGGTLAHEIAKNRSWAPELENLGFCNWSDRQDDGSTVLHLYVKSLGRIPDGCKDSLFLEDGNLVTVAEMLIESIEGNAVRRFGLDDEANSVKQHACESFLSKVGSKIVDKNDLEGLTPVQQAVFITKVVDALLERDPVEKNLFRAEALEVKNWKEADGKVLDQFKWLPHVSSGPADASAKIQEVLDGKRDSLIPGGLRGANPREFQKKGYEGLCARYGIDPYAAESNFDREVPARSRFAPRSEREPSERVLNAERGVAEKISRVFGKDIEKASRYIENHPKNVYNENLHKANNWKLEDTLPPQKKLHDAEFSLPKGEYRREEWAGFLAKFPGAGKFLADADEHDKVHPSLPEGVNELKTRMSLIGYGPLADMNPEVAKMAAALEVSKADFAHIVKLMPEAKKEALLPNIALVGEDELSGFRVRLLEKGDPKALIIGMSDLSSCCQRLGGVGEAAAIHSFKQPSSGVYVVENTRSGELVAQTWAWLSSDQKTVVFDSVESKFNDESMTKITQAMLLELAVEMKKDGYNTILSKTNYGMTKDISKEMGLKAADSVTAPRMMVSCSYTDCKPGSKAFSLDGAVANEMKVRTFHTSRVGRDIEKLPPIHLVKWDKRQDDIEIKKTVKGFKAEIAFTKDGDDVLIKVRAGNKEGLIANEVRRVHIAEKGVTWTQAKEIEEYKAAALRMVERRASLPEAQRTKLMTAIAQQSQATEPKAAKEEGRIPSRFSKAPDVREERPPERERRPAARSM